MCKSLASTGLPIVSIRLCSNSTDAATPAWRAAHYLVNWHAAELPLHLLHVMAADQLSQSLFFLLNSFLNTPLGLVCPEAGSAGDADAEEEELCCALVPYCDCMVASMSYKGMNSMGGSTCPHRICTQSEVGLNEEVDLVV